MHISIWALTLWEVSEKSDDSIRGKLQEKRTDRWKNGRTDPNSQDLSSHGLWSKKEQGIIGLLQSLCNKDCKRPFSSFNGKSKYETT